MIAGSDSETGEVVVDDRPSQGGASEGGRQGAIEGEDGDDGQGQGRDDVDLLVEVSPGDGRERPLLTQGALDVIIVIHGSLFIVLPGVARRGSEAAQALGFAQVRVRVVVGQVLTLTFAKVRLS